MQKDEFKQLKKEFDDYVEGIEYARSRKIYSKEVKRLAKDFVLKRFGLTNAVERLALEFYAHHTFEPEPKPTFTEAQTRLCEIMAVIEEIGQLKLRLSVMVRKAIAEEPYLSSSIQNNK